MHERPSRTDLLTALLAGVAGVAGSFAVAGYTRQFLVAPIDALIVRATPGPIVAFMIQTVGDAGHLLHVGMAVAAAVALLAGGVVLGLATGRRLDRPLAGAAVAGLLALATSAAITGQPAASVGTAAPVFVVSAVGVAATSRSSSHDPSRRHALRTGGSALALVGLSAGYRLLGSSDGAGGDGSTDRGGEVGSDGVIRGEVTEYLQQADDQALDVAGDDLPGLVTPIGDFYNVDIAEFDPKVPAEDWSLGVTGEVGSGVTVSFEELTDMPTEHRYVTLRCVGESLNGRKMDTAVWTGTPVAPLLEEADPAGDCDCVMVHARDDYFVQFPVEALEDGLLAWGMNGRALPTSHGHPVRLLVPGHWGETNVKWIDEIELLDEAADGYWEKRGWHGTGPVNTVAKLWDDTPLDDGRHEVAGHAYAGTRGIDRVEVSIDGGDSWTDATLSEPLPGDDVWRQWRHAFEPDGNHEVVVRAIDGEGTLQAREQSDSYPSGATGWVSQWVA